MKYLLRIYNFLLTVVLCMVVGGILFSIFDTPSNMGWDQLADFLGALMISGLIGLIAAVFVTLRVSIPNAKKLALYGSILLALIILALRIMNPKPPEPEQEPVQKPLAPTEPISVLSEGEEVAMFYAQFSFKDGPVYFYGPEGSDELAQDSVVFENGRITYAPPHFFPYYMKEDYQLVQCKGIAKTRDKVQIEINKSNGLTTWVEKGAIKVLAPEDLILSSSSIKPLRLLDYPFRIKPMDHASPISAEYPEHIFRPIQVRGDFIQVRIEDYQNRQVNRAWLRWRKDGRLLIQVKPLN